MTYPEAIRALNEAAYVALRASYRNQPEDTRVDLLWFARETDRLVDALPGHVTEK